MKNLSQERTVLSNASKLAAAALEAEQALYGADGAATDTVARAEARLVEAAALDPKLGDALEMIKSARANLEEAARTLGAYASKIEADPARLEEIDNRLQELTRLKRKYGGSIDTAIETLGAIARRNRRTRRNRRVESAGRGRRWRRRSTNSPRTQTSCPRFANALPPISAARWKPS